MKIIGKERSFEKKEIKNKKIPTKTLGLKMQASSKFAGNFLRENEAIRRSVSLRMQIFYLNLLNIYKEQQHLKIVQKFMAREASRSDSTDLLLPKAILLDTACVVRLCATNTRLPNVRLLYQ